MKGDQLQPSDNLDMFCVFVGKSENCEIQCLSEKTQFLGFLFRSVMLKH